MTADATTTVVLLMVDAGSDQSVSEGSTANLAGAKFQYEGNASTLTPSIDWGDGSTGPATLVSSTGAVQGTHVYKQNGVFHVLITLGAPGGSTVTGRDQCQGVKRRSGRFGGNASRHLLGQRLQLVWFIHGPW